ncbi:MAG: type II toxin-antitoxin system Rv0910 family toxin [Marmoricola sp.]
MGHVETTKTVAAAPEQVFALFTDNARRGEWLTIHEKWLEEPPATITTGSRLVEKVVMLGMANKIEWTVDEFDAPTSVTQSGTGMAGVKVKLTTSVIPDGDGSAVTVSADFEGAMIVGALGKAVEKDMLANLDASLAKLEALASA